MDLLTPRISPKSALPLHAHTEAVGPFGVFHPCLRPSKTPGCTLGRVAKPLVSYSDAERLWTFVNCDRHKKSLRSRTCAVYTHQVPAIGRDVAEEGDEQMHVNRKPEYGEQRYDEDQQPTDGLLPAEGLGAAHAGRRAGALASDVDEHADRQGGDDGQRKRVAEREERGEENAADLLADDVAVGQGGRSRRPAAVRRDDRQIEQRYGHPDDDDDDDGGTRRPVAGGARPVDDRQVPHHGNGHQRVHGHICRHVDEIVGNRQSKYCLRYIHITA